MSDSSRPLFTSRLGMLLTMVGVSVGLGNVWRFPYMMGQYGGSAFLLIYLACVLLLAVPALTAEWSLGRHTRRGPMGALPQVFDSRWGGLIGIVLLITVLVADAYYIVVIGQIVMTGAYSLTPGFSAESWPGFTALLGSGPWQFGVSAGLLLASLVVIAQGLNRGIERVSRIFVPFFAVVMIYLVITALRLDGAWSHLRDFLRPDFAAIHARDWFAALGQAFFSLGLGGTFFVVYGSYLPDDQRLAAPALGTALGDTSAALLAGLFIVPATLALGLDLGQGPNLIFDTLPHLFMAMPGGRWLGGLFLAGLAMVAFLSNIAALEVAAAGLRDRPKPWSKKAILCLIGAVELALFVPITWDNDWISVLDLIFGSGMQVSGSLMAVLAVGWGIRRGVVQQQIFGRATAYGALYVNWLRWVIPLALFAILLSYIASLFKA